MGSRLALIDGDALVFSAGYVIKKPDPAINAFALVKNTISRIMDKTQASDYKVYLGDSDKTNFRYQVAKEKPYKENRKKHKRPDYEQEIRNYLFEHHSAIMVVDMETDDALGIEQSSLMEHWDVPETDCETIICSNDKDLDMIPGWHFDLDFGKTRTKKDGNSYKLKAYKKTDKYFIKDPGFLSLRKNPENGRNVLCGGGYLWFCAQLLLGDTTDNIPSLSKGYGPKRVYEVLKNAKTEEQGIKYVYDEYKNILADHLTEEQIQTRLMEVGRLCWIKRKLNNDIIFPRSWLC